MKEQAIKRIERTIKDVERDLSQAEGVFNRCDEGSWEQGQALATIRKLQRKLGALYDDLDSHEEG